MSYLIRRVLAKPRLILGEMYRLYGKFASYLRRALCKTRLIFPRINGPNMKNCSLVSPHVTLEYLWYFQKDKKALMEILKIHSYIIWILPYVISQDICKNNLVELEGGLNVSFPWCDHINKDSIDFILGIVKEMMHSLA